MPEKDWRWLPRRVPDLTKSVWGFTGAVLAVVLGLGAVVSGLYDHADEQRQAQVMASELETDAAELQLAEDALMSGSQESIGARAEITDELGDLRRRVLELKRISDAEMVSAIERDLRAVETGLESQLALLQLGDVETAHEVDELQTDPAFAVFDERMETAHDHFKSAAERVELISDVGLWLAVLASGITIGGLSWRHERARRASQAALEQRLRERAEEVAAVTERHRQLEAMKYSFITAVSHELRTPLTAIHSSLAMLEDGDAGQLPTPAVRIVSIASRGASRLTRLVNDIIDLERLANDAFVFHLAPRDLDALLLNAVESMAPLAERAGLDLLLHESHLDVLCDGDRLIQAVVNLISNAIKFSSPGGTIEVGAVRRDDEVEISVRDEGRGIPVDHVDSVFDRFSQVDSDVDQAKGGAGLGLSITRHIVEAQGGRIWVESEPGVGTAFHFTLPLALAASVVQ